MTRDMPLPHDLNAERAVVGAVLCDWTLLDQATIELEAEDFYAPRHGVLWEAMQHLHAGGAPIDTVTVRAELVCRRNLEQAGGDEYVLGLSASALPVVAHVETHARIVREHAVARAIATAAARVVARATEGGCELAALIEYADATIFRATERRETKPLRHVGEIAQELYADLERAADSDVTVTGLPSGVERLDVLTSGFHGGDMVVIAGRPGMGKSALAGCIAINASRASGRPTAIFSLEMPEKLYIRRMAGSESRVDQQRIRQGRLSKEDWPAIARATEAITQLPVWIDDTAQLTVMQLRSKARRLRAQQGLGLVVVDYLQLMTAGVRTQSREEEVAIISRSLKALAKELDIPVIALAQLNREVEKRPQKRPHLGDLRESGAIEQDADVVLMLYRDELYDKRSKDRGIAEIIVAKQRSGPTGTVRCRFFDEFTRFDNLAWEDDPQAQLAIDDEWTNAAE